MFNCFEPQVVFQEVPDEIALAFTITGCTLGCKGCHSTDTWDPRAGIELSEDLLQNYISTYKQYITCVLFFGGEWSLKRLLACLSYVKACGLKSCLYTGLDDVPSALKHQLDYLKTGAYIKALGGLENPETNQRFYHLPTQTNLNYKFWKRSYVDPTKITNR
uniref:anaerobic ribonucleoside-triphosphate reductase activating protein n=1 Tax=Ningiella ruwaisensis TaxID=2364274 RepID=UPI0019D67D67|nr:anaerobic ribonucleoside-triphosphate reductase activating protein [Ningiella ruwaisensis]